MNDSLFLEYLKNRDSLIVVFPNIPEGWRLQPTSFGLFKDNVCRGCLVIKRISPPYAIFEIELKKRYHVDCFAGDKKVCVLDYNNAVIKEIGKVEDIWSEDVNKLIQQGYEWLDKNYPDWKDPTKYWEE